MNGFLEVVVLSLDLDSDLQTCRTQLGDEVFLKLNYSKHG